MPGCCESLEGDGRMRCPKCEFENPEGMNFCGKCGSKIEVICPECGFSNPAEFSFCGKCGHNLKTPPGKPPVKELTTEEKLDKIQKYLPPQVAEKILAQRGQIEGERKLVTVMFCDMKGYTSLSEKLDPEDVYSIMDQVYEILIREVHAFEGTVNELTGDGIMALFGAPLALEDAPQRAIRSALAIHHKIARFSDKLRRENPGAPPLKMRVGIHTGPVVVGTLGNDLRVEFKAVGDTVNLASRMETMAEPGTTFVTEDTFKLTEGYFRFEGLGAQDIKGKEKAVNVFRVIAPSTRRTRFDVSTERGLTRFVGRERELEIMLDCLERTKTGRGQAISIVAEAGIGKSRLLYEFRKAIANEDVTFFEGRCLSYSRNVPFYPIIDLLKSVFGLKEDDSEEDIKEKLKKGLQALNADETSILPYLLEVLSVKDTGLNPMALSPEGKRDRISSALKQVVLKGASQRPLVLAIEDLYWVDNSSVDVFKDLLDDIGGAAVFLIFTYRPNFVHTWGAKSYHSQITLNHLSNQRKPRPWRQSLLGTENIESDLEELILEKTEGVPLYIEEFIRTLKELKIIAQTEGPYRIVKDVRELSVPSTIQDVIMARVDALPETAKEVLQAGSVIEREFSYVMIQKVTGLTEKELLSALSVLKDAELVFERGIYPDSSFIFKHALTRDVVYNSLLTKKRKKLHEATGNIIEASAGERLSEYYEVLAEHFTRSDRYEKAIEYLKLAERKAEKSGLIHDAISYAEKRASCIEVAPSVPDMEKQIVNARVVIGLYWTQLTRLMEAKEAIDPIVDLAITNKYKRRIAHINIILGFYYTLIKEQFDVAQNHFGDALRAGEELSDFLTVALGNNHMGTCLSFVGEFDKSLSCFSKALNISLMANLSWSAAAIKSNLVIFVYFPLGDFKNAYKISRESIELSYESGDILSKGSAHCAAGLTYYMYGDLERSIKHFTNSLEMLKKCGFFTLAAVSSWYLAMSYLYLNKYEEALIYCNTALHLNKQGNYFPSFAKCLKLIAAFVRLMKKDEYININEILSNSNDINIVIADFSVAYYAGKIILNTDHNNVRQAHNWIKKSMETNQKYGMKWNLAHDYALYSEYYQKIGDDTKAKESLNKAIEIFKECGTDGWVEKYEKEYSDLLQ